MRAAVFAAGAAILADGLVMAVAGNLGMGVVLTVLLGAALTAYGIFFRSINGVSGPVKWLRNLGLAGLGCLLAMSVFLAAYGKMDSNSEDVEAFIVLGAAVCGDVPSRALSHRLNRAAELHRENPGALIVVSGGKGFQEDISEAEAMRRYLLEKGVPDDLILMEDRSSSTRENFRYSKEILDGKLEPGYLAACVTNDFHVYRACLIAKSEGLGNIAHFHAATDWFIWPQSYLRECFAVVKTWIFG